MGNTILGRNYIPFVSTTPLTGKTTPIAGQKSNHANADFQLLLQQEMQKQHRELTFSKHATQRIGERQIDMTPTLLSQVSDAVDRAENKGIRDALILGEHTAFIVNIPSRIVVTTMSSQEMKNNIITNIDGTVIL